MTTEAPAVGGTGADPRVEPPVVVVAMLTYQRTDDLLEAIPAVLAQLRGVARASLLIVDNDPAGSASATVARWAAAGVRYAHEHRPGIAAARNRALDESADANMLIFIDDDERPTDGWYAALLATWADHPGAGAVVGPVVSEFDAPLEPWIEAGRFFDRRRLPTGTATDVAATNNLLLDLALVRREGLRFDERFGQSGGSDTLFTRQLARHAPLIWCDEAVVVDRVPVQRLTRQWVLRRAFRSGNSWVRTSLVLAPTATARLAVRVRASARGSVRFAAGAGRLAAGLLTRSLVHQAKGRRTMARGGGMLAGAYGHVHEEYRREPAEVVAAGPVVVRSGSLGPPGAGHPDGRPALGIVVVNYGTHGLLPSALTDLADAVPARVVVVDNLHSEQERVAVTGLCAERGWTLVAMPTNTGFGVAANAGAATAIADGCEAILVLNPDASITADGCERLLGLARANPRSLISPVILRPDGSRWFAGSRIDPRSGHLMGVAGPFVSGPQSWLTGAALVASAEIWTELGGFADGYFLYWEDVDLSTRCVMAGGTLILAEEVTAIHEVGGTQTAADRRGRAKSAVYYRYNCRNRLVYAARLLPRGQVLSWLVRTPVESAAILLRGGRRQLLTSPRVWWAALSGSAAGVGAVGFELAARAARGRGGVPDINLGQRPDVHRNGLPSKAAAADQAHTAGESKEKGTRK